jgi:hypothetical protein
MRLETSRELSISLFLSGMYEAHFTPHFLNHFPQSLTACAHIGFAKDFNPSLAFW